MNLHDMQSGVAANKELYSTSEAAVLLQVSSQTVRRWINNGQLEAVQFPSGQFKISQGEIDRILTPVRQSPASAGSPDDKRSMADFLREFATDGAHSARRGKGRDTA